jgi:hypothetical protein
MSATELLAWLEGQGVSVEVHDGELSCDAPQGFLTPKIVASLRQHKQDLLRLVAAAPVAQSFGQRRLWFLQRLNPGTTAYNEQAAIHLIGLVRLLPLEQALTRVVQRHDILRTVFSASATGTPIQSVERFAHVPIAIVDLEGLSPEHALHIVREGTKEDANRPFCLESAPPLRIVVYRCSAANHTLLLSMHHIVSDGWSMGVLFREFAAMYAAFASGGIDRLRPLTRQYVDFARWQTKRFEEPLGVRALQYWKARLSGLPLVIELPTDFPRPQVQSFEGASLAFQLDRFVSRGVRELVRQTGSTTFLCLLTAFQTLLHRYSGLTEFVLGVPVSGRDDSDFTALIGFFSNTLVISADFRESPSFRQLLTRARTTIVEAYENQRAPFECVVEALQPARSLRHSPVVQIVFTFQGGMLGDASMPNVRAELLDLPSRSSKFDLVLSMDEREDGLSGRFTYCSALFREQTLERMAAHFGTILKSALARPDVPASELALLTPEERALLSIPTRVAELERPYQFL